MAKPGPVVDAEYLKEIEKARRYFRFVIIEKNCAHLMLRLAWHDACTYDAKTKTGGPNGSLRNEGVLNRSENKGLALDTAVKLCEDVKAKYPRVSYADIYQLAGVVAVEVGGGPTIDFVPGRKDSPEFPPEGRLPDAKQGASHLRDVFHRMGLHDIDIVALSGGYALARGAWKPWKFDNSYFVKLPKSKDPSDKVLVDDPEFRKYVERYAQDEDIYFADYAASHKKLSELGHNLKPFRSMLVQGVTGVIIASAAVILGYLFRMYRRTR